MRNILKFFILSLSIFALTGCSSKEEKVIEMEKVTKTFEATVLNVQNSSIIVCPDTNSEENLISNQFIVDISNADIINVNSGIVTKDNLHINCVVEITYDGNVNESYTCEIKSSQVKIINENILTYHIKDVKYDKEWKMYRGTCVDEEVEKEYLFSIPEELKGIEIFENEKIIIETIGGMTMSNPPQLIGIINIYKEP